MRKLTICVLLFFFVGAIPVYAHLVGAFKDFLTAVNDASAAMKMQEDAAKAEQEITKYSQLAEQLERQYAGQETETVSRLQAYDALQLDLLAYVLTDSDEVIDMLTNKYLIDQQMDSFLSDLEYRFLEYMPVKSAKESLESHKKLLEMLNIQLRERKELQQRKQWTSDKLAKYVIEQWNAHAGGYLKMKLKADNRLMKENLPKLVTRKSEASPFRLEEALLNYKSELQYMIRSDHIYVFFERKDVHVLLIGSLTSQSSHAVRLRFEAGFFNGVELPESMLALLDGFELDSTALFPNSRQVYVELASGAVMMQAMEQSGE